MNERDYSVTIDGQCFPFKVAEDKGLCVTSCVYGFKTFHVKCEINNTDAVKEIMDVAAENRFMIEPGHMTEIFKRHPSMGSLKISYKAS